jgi:hypothetical protein
MTSLALLQTICSKERIRRRYPLHLVKVEAIFGKVQSMLALSIGAVRRWRNNLCD